MGGLFHPPELPMDDNSGTRSAMGAEAIQETGDGNEQECSNDELAPPPASPVV